MQLEFHQLDRSWEHLRVHDPGRQLRLLASLAESGQQAPIVVVAVDGQPDRYVVIDGFKRVTALQQLGLQTPKSSALRYPPLRLAEGLSGCKVCFQPSPAGYSSTGCSPAEPASASPTEDNSDGEEAV